MTLFQLRLTVPLQDLERQWPMHHYKWIHAMYVYILYVLVNWPDRETLWKNLIFAFDVIVIADCFEIFMNKPSSLDSRAMIFAKPLITHQ